MQVPSPKNTSQDAGLRLLIPWLMTLATSAIVVGNLLQVDVEVLTNAWVEPVIFAGLAVFALYFAGILNESQLSAVHMIGMVAFLTLTPTTAPLMTLFFFVAAILGAILQQVRVRFNPLIVQRPSSSLSVLFVVNRVLLGYWLSGIVYLALGGGIPIGAQLNNDFVVELPLLLYVLTYTGLHFIGFMLEVMYSGRQIVHVVRHNLARITVILLMPVPFAVLGAEVLSRLGAPSRVIFIGGVLLIVLAIHALSMSELQLRRQLDEMRTLSVVTRAMRAHLNLDALLRTIYVQVAHLLVVEDFEALLHDPVSHELQYALVMREGEEQTRLEGKGIGDEPTLIHYVISTMQPLLIPSNPAEVAEQLGVTRPSMAITTWLGVPLQAGGRVLGVLVVVSRDPQRSFTPDELRLLNIVAASSSIAIENAQLYEEQRQRAEQLTALNQVASLLSGTLKPETVLDTIISSASAVSKAHAIAVYLYMDENEMLSLVRSAGLSERYTIGAPPPLLGRVVDMLSARNDEGTLALAVNDIRLDDRAVPMRDMLRSEELLAFVELALNTGNSVLGIIIMYFNTPQFITGDNIEVLKTFASQAAQAIVNARTYTSADRAFQRSVEQLLSLAGIGRLLTSTVDVETICQLVIEHATSATRVEVGMVLLRDDDSQVLHLIVQRGYPDHLPSELTSATIWRDVMASGEPLGIEDLRLDKRYHSWLSSTRSMLAVPIVRGDDPLGVIVLESTQRRAFREEDSYFVGQIANQAAIAINNARLFTRIAKDRDRMEVILNAMEEGVLLINRSGYIVLANPRIDLIGLRQAQVNWQSLPALVDDAELAIVQRMGFSSADDVQTLLDTMGRDGGYPPVMYVTSGQHGDLHIRRHIIPVRNENEAIIGLLLVFYNKTEEEELARSREELTRMIVHDLRSPLTAVTTSLKLLNDLVPHDSDFRSLVESTTDASRRAIRKLLSRVDAMLDIAKLESGELKLDTDLTELAPLVDNVITDLYPLAHELEVTIRSELTRELPLLNIDADKVERLILNLVDNALKYSPRKSEIVIRAQPKPDARGFVRIEIVDQGPGIPDDYKAHLFERFVQIDGRRKVRRGVGLGLTFCRLVTSAHRGTIHIEDNPSGGSIFAFTLPIASLQTLTD